MDTLEPNDQNKDMIDEIEDRAETVWRRISEQWTEILSAIMLSLVAVFTAWTGYQASQWGGVQSLSFSQASSKRVESTRSSTLAGQQITIDLILFSEWLGAFAYDQDQLAQFYEERFRDEFKPAFEAWVATDPENNPNAPESPFFMPEYVLEAQEKAAEFESEAEILFEEGREANSNADEYVFTTVLLASVLFFAGMTTRFEWQFIRWVLLVFAAFMLVIGLYNVLTLPIEGDILDFIKFRDLF